MTIKNLYKFQREDGGTTVSTVKPDAPHTPMFRIIADEGKNVTRDGINTYPVIDSDSSDGWYEVDNVEETETKK